MQYPSESELDACLRAVAVEAGDTSGAPFRISLVRLHGKPPMYSVVILSASKEPMRQRLGKLLARNFSLGVTSIFLTVAEVESLMAHCHMVRQETKA